MYFHRHLGPGLRRQRYLSIDPGRPTPSVALGHLPHTHQRVRPGPQHHLLQGPDLGPVLLPRRLEDPPPQPPHVTLMGSPADGVPVQSVLRSVHRQGVQLVPRLVGMVSFGVQRLTCPRQRPFGPSPPGLISGQLSQTIAEGGDHVVCVPVAFRPPAFASWASCSRREFRSPYGRPTRHRLDHDGVSTFHTFETRPDWAPSLPRDQAVLSRPVRSLRSPLAASSNGQVLSPRSTSHLPELSVTGHHQGFTFVRPPGLPLVRDPPDGTGPLGLFPGLRTPTGRTCGARQGGDGY